MTRGRPERTEDSHRHSFGFQLLLAAGVVFVLLAIVGQLTVVPAKRELDAIWAMERSGCGVTWRAPADEVKTPVGVYRRSWFTWILGEKFFSSVRQVDIRRNLDDKIFSQVAQLRSYDELHALLRGTSTTDASLRRLVSLPRLRVAELASTQITDTAVAELAAANDLEVLNLEHTRVTDQAVASLAAMPKLRELNLEGSFVSGGAVERLKKAKPQLAIQWATAPSEDERAAAAELDGIYGVVVRATRRQSGATAYVVGMESNAIGYRRTASGSPAAGSHSDRMRNHVAALSLLGRLPQLVALRLCHFYLTLEDVDCLVQAKTIRDLYLEGGGLVSAAEQIARLTGLHKLTLVGVTMANRELELVGSLPQLEVLVVRWPATNYRYTDDFFMRDDALNDEGLECLRRMPRLRRLVLRTAVRRELPGLPTPPNGITTSTITDAGLTYVRALPNLESLDLSGTEVTPAGLMRLEGMAKLRELVILGIPIDGEQEAKLRRALPQATIRTGPLAPSERYYAPGPSTVKYLAELLKDEDSIP